MKADDKYLLENVLPLLGLTDWTSMSGGRTRQMEYFKYKLHKFLKPKRKARESSAEESVAAPASTALPESVAVTESVAVPASALPASGPLSQKELRAKRAMHFGFKLSHADTGGKRLHTRKLRRKRKSKSSKRSCKRR